MSGPGTVDPGHTSLAQSEVTTHLDRELMSRPLLTHRFLPLLACGAFALGACRGAPASTEPVATTAQKGTLEWFGFVGVSCQVDDPNDDVGPSDYLDETAAFTNLAHVCAFDLDMRDELTATHEAGVHAMLDVSSLLFEWVPGPAPSGSGSRVVLRADAEEQWATFVLTNESVLDRDHIAALYLVDEPAWNGATTADIDAAARLVEATHPELPSVIVEAPDALDDAHFPASVDWIGFDRYGTVDPATDVAYQANLTTLRRLSTSRQRLLLVVDTQWQPIYEQVGLEPSDMADIARNYVAFAKSTDDVIALVGYSWPGGIDGPDQLGARDLPPSVRAAYAELGAAIIGR